MKLYPIYAVGIQAYCSDLIVDPDGSDTVYFMSIAGYQATVKGILANLLENYDINIKIEGSEYSLTRASLGYKAQMRKLPSGLVHGVLFPKLALPKNEENGQTSFYLFTKAEDDAFRLFIRHLDEKTEIPLHDSWEKWLWEVFLENEWILELETLAGSYRGFSFVFNQKKLQDTLSEAIRGKNPEIIKCFEWKGGNGDGQFDFSKRIP